MKDDGDTVYSSRDNLVRGEEKDVGYRYNERAYDDLKIVFYHALARLFREGENYFGFRFRKCWHIRVKNLAAKILFFGKQSDS